MTVQKKAKYAICLNNRGYTLDLEKLKAYRVISDPESENEGMVRIVDETGEDYVYPQARFHFVELPTVTKAVRSRTVKSRRLPPSQRTEKAQ